MKKVYILLMAALGVVSCENYLDINTDPNSVSEEVVTSSMLFPAVEMNISASYNNFMHMTGSYYAQHYAQSFGTSNYLDYSKFTMSATRSSSTYTQLTVRGLNNIATILSKAEAAEEWGTYLAATTMRAFTYQAMVDAWGEIPYSEALDTSNLSPAYDEGEDIYNGILAELDAALALCSSGDTVCDNFLFNGSSSASNWIKFANALKLRILMRMSGVASVSTELAALVAEDNFPTEDVAFSGIYANASGQANPFYQEEISTWGKNQTDCIVNIALLGTMEEVNDPRKEAFFVANVDGEYVGGVSGSNFSTGDTSEVGASYLCIPAWEYDTPAVLIGVCETEFFLAEYYASKGNYTEAQAHYEAAIEASFTQAGVSGASDIYTNSIYAWDSSKALELIYMQKWVALAGFNGFEAWCEVRRTGYPKFDSSITGESIFSESAGTYDASAYTPGTLYTPTYVDSEVGNNQTIQRYKYPQSSTSTNSNSPTTKLLNVPVFWAE
ncbi:MAG: SusD/RagB family nutrient-binding outer membrane lipoprotein [Rikenellaceae bacterium]